MKDLNYQLKQISRRNRDGSHATQRDRERLLTLIANQLEKLGFRYMSAHSLKPKHIEALVELWQHESLGLGTIKNRMAALRWWAGKVDKLNVIARDNAHYGIASRELIASRSKAAELDEQALARVGDEYVRLSLRLQAAHGLRREEAIRFRPRFANRGDHLSLKPSWKKDGRARHIPIRTDAQRRLLNEVKCCAPRAEAAWHYLRSSMRHPPSR